ncbi:acyltransferase family protein [Haemophilus haemolyticus]|uniref:acyltransferase family protein n=1 Tax=Haemophilus haemolyticus TaxID=726 RepID=UPI0035944885
MKSKHIIELDSWRGIMALLVAIFHYTVPNNFVSAELAVDFFFILSGIVIQKSYFDKEMSSTEFFIKRLYRLYPLHLFSLIILLFLFLSTVFFASAASDVYKRQHLSTLDLGDVYKRMVYFLRLFNRYFLLMV